MFGARNFFLTAARAVGDSLWNYVTALFSTTSTNGAQNNTFLDSSSNNFTITRNGNTTQGSFSPYEPTGYWSNYFDGSGDSLTAPSNTAFALGTGDFTVECWINLSSVPGGGAFPSILEINQPSFFINFRGSGTFALTDASTVYAQSAVSLVAGVWYHIAVVRSSGSSRVYVNGIGGTAVACTANFSQGVASVGGGNSGVITGYISNFRLLKGTALYTADFTPPTSPLTAIANTSLLTCQSNRFIDNSSNNFTITRNGDVSVQAFSPLGNTTPYSTAAVGGSGYFDGSGDFLQVADAAAMELGSGNWTIELWVNTLTNTQYSALWTRDDGSITAGSYALLLNTTSANGFVTFWAADINGFAAFILSSGSVSCRDGAWHHIAVVRNSNTLTMYIDGVSTSTASYSGAFANTAQPIKIGAETGYARDYAGYMAGVRLVVGTAVYTSNFTPPTAPVAAITNTQLLLNFTNAGVFDSAAVNDFETAGNAQVSTTQAKFGPTSMYFDGSGDWVNVPPTQNLEFDGGNFTMEFWLYPVDTTRRAIYHGSDGADWSIGIDFQSQKVCIWASSNGSSWNLINADGGGNGIGTITVPLNTWSHVVFVRFGNTWQTYINGNRDLNLTVSGSIVNRATFAKSVGKWFFTNGVGSPTMWNGYIDDLRITKGYPRYWYNFPVPTSAFPVQYAPEVIPPNDPLFDYVTMLLPGNGTNGAQNNTFLDSSTNNFTVTRNGNTTQGTFTPYGANWSNFFNGSTDFLTTPTQTAFAFGTGAFTVEAWVYLTDNNTYNRIIGLGIGASGGAPHYTAWALQFINLNLSWYRFDGTETAYTSSSTASLNTWNHIVAVRDGSNNFAMFLNGVRVFNQTVSLSYNAVNSDPLYIGRTTFGGGTPSLIAGYVSNARIVKGSAVYDPTQTTLTVPTAPLTVIANTSLLTCADNRFIDDSTNNFTITANGSPSVQRFSAFNPPASYSAATNGGSGYFDGSGDKVLVATNSNMTLGTNDFTVELWAYPLALDGSRCFTTQADPTFDLNGYWIGSNGTGLYWLVGNGSSWAILRTVGTLTLNAWNHIALTRSGTTFRAFINGVLIDTQTSSVSLSNANNTVAIGGRDAGAVQYSNSYISGYRVLNGTCLYTATFTPPTTPPTVITNTQLLTNFTNAGVIDNAMMNDLETVGTAQVSTTQSKFGGGSMFFNGSGSYLVGASTPQIGLGSSDFTIEMWVYLTANFDGTGQGLVTAAYNTNFAVIGVNGGGGNRIDFYVANVLLGTGTNYISLNTWTHLAFTRASGTTRIFFNGNQVASSTSQTGTGAAAPIFVGTLSHDTPRVMTGYIDDLRITKGIARYVQPFTPPTQAFQTQ